MRDSGGTERAFPLTADARDVALGPACVHPRPAKTAGNAQVIKKNGYEFLELKMARHVLRRPFFSLGKEKPRRFRLYAIPRTFIAGNT